MEPKRAQWENPAWEIVSFGQDDVIRTSSVAQQDEGVGETMTWSDFTHRFSS